MISLVITLISLVIIIFSLLNLKFRSEANEKYEKYMKIRAVVSAFIFAVCIPFLINEAYKVGEGYTVAWNAGDMLAFYGAILTFAGTSFLSYVALKQNERLLKIEENREMSENACDIMIFYDNSDACSKELSNDLDFHFSESKRLHFSIENYSNAVLRGIRFEFDNDVFESSLVLTKNNPKSFFVKLPEYCTQDSLVKVTYISCNNVKTYADFKLNSIDGNKNLFSKKHYHYYGLERSAKNEK